MALDFPSSPVNGQIFGDYAYDSVVGAWRSVPVLPGGLPAGSIMAWTTATAPSNWLICDGSVVSRATYASLYSVIATTYGVGDGSTTFNLPDLRGRVPVGKNAGTFATLGSSGGEETHTLSISEMPSHTHGPNGFSFFAGMNNTIQYAAGSAKFSIDGLMATTGPTGGGGSHNNLQPYLTLNYIIKSSGANTPGDSALATRVGSLEGLTTSFPAGNITSGSLPIAQGGTGVATGAGLVPVIPTSVAVGSGTGSVNAAGLITFTGASSISFNGVFTSAYRNYKVLVHAQSNTGYNDTTFRFRIAGTDRTVNYWSWGWRANSASGALVGANNTTGMYTGMTVSLQNTFATWTADIIAPAIVTASTVTSLATGFDSAALVQASMGLFMNESVAYDGGTIISNANNFTGTLKIYGYN